MLSLSKSLLARAQSTLVNSAHGTCASVLQQPSRLTACDNFIAVCALTSGCTDADSLPKMILAPKTAWQSSVAGAMTRMHGLDTRQITVTGEQWRDRSQCDRNLCDYQA